MSAGRLIAFCFVFVLMPGCTSKDRPADAPTGGMLEIIPRPNQVATSSGAFLLQRSTTIAVPEGSDVRWVGTWLADLLQRTTRMDLHVTDRGSAPASNIVLFEIGPLPADSGREAYRLLVSPEKIVVTANDTAGLFYGAVSLWQLASAVADDGATIRIPAVQIDDAPRFAWRGLMLDVARHYVAPPYIKQMIDWMALHKLNVLHWHLTDDQGWRLEIKAYPRLTEVGAWRTPAGPAAQHDIDPATGKPRQYGGYYTQDEVRDIVAYAAERQVTIVPEIEMPGHAQAAIAAYPELGVDGVKPKVSPDWGIHNYLFSVEESTFAALEAILSEVLELFPGRYIHIGGDEAVKDQWIASVRVQRRMRELGVANEAELQSYFVKRIEAFLQAHGRRLIGWDEILEGGIAPQATVMSWRGVDGAVEAASQGHDTVLSPAPTLYFDYRQSGLASEPPGRGPIVSLEEVYHFNPIPPEFTQEERRHVLGLQANVWSEHIRTEDRLSYMIFPRAAAVAEVAWTEPAHIDWRDFVRRLGAQFDRYRVLGLPFATSAFDVRAIAETAGADPGAEVELSNQSGLGEIRYTVDGSTVTAASTLYDHKLDLPFDTELAAATFANGRQMSRVTRGNVGELSRRRFSQELTTCTERLVLSLEDDAPVRGQRSDFLIDVMNPCWMWPQADLSAVSGIRAAVGQVPFNFQIGADRDKIELPEPRTAAGELEVRANGCDGRLLAVIPLEQAAESNEVTVLAQEFAEPQDARTDLCFRFTADKLDPMWAIDWIELTGPEEP